MRIERHLTNTVKEEKYLFQQPCVYVLPEGGCVIHHIFHFHDLDVFNV